MRLEYELYELCSFTTPHTHHHSRRPAPHECILPQQASYLQNHSIFVHVEAHSRARVLEIRPRRKYHEHAHHPDRDPHDTNSGDLLQISIRQENHAHQVEHAPHPKLDHRDEKQHLVSFHPLCQPVCGGAVDQSVEEGAAPRPGRRSRSPRRASCRSLLLRCLPPRSRTTTQTAGYSARNRLSAPP